MIRVLLFLSVFSFGCGASQIATNGISSLAFLEGDWVSEDDGTRSEEHWVREGDTLVGRAQITAGEEVVHSETLRIEARDGSAVYVASPQGQTPVEFRLTDSSDHHAVFENPTHDFPTSISYRREGDQLHAQIAGPGQEPMSWTFSRVVSE